MSHATPWSPDVLLSADTMAAAVNDYLRTSNAATPWNVEESFDWDRADAGKLTEGQRSAVRFTTLIEDHLPGYFSIYEKHFPVDGSVDQEMYLHNRELYHFTIGWAKEEDNHARALINYQVRSGVADIATVRKELAEEGQKEFDLPYDHPVQFFAYALVQEKATQLYYQQLREVAGDPILRDVLVRLSRDEARHFTFMADVVSRYLHTHGDDVVDPIRDVIATFRMPLADTIRGYWRWALKISDVADHDMTDAYDHLVNTINRAVDAKTDRMTELVRFIGEVRSIH